MLKQLCDHARNWFKTPMRFGTELSLALICKFLLLYGLWILCFSQPTQIPLSHDQVAHMLLNR